MCPIFNGCGDTAVWMLCIKALQKVWRKTNDVLIAFISYINDPNKIAPVQGKCSKINPLTSVHFTTFLATVHVGLLRWSWRSCFMMAALFIMRATNSSLMFIFLCRLCFSSIQNSELYVPNLNSCIFTPIESWTHVYVNLFTWNSPYFYLLKYLLFLLKHPNTHQEQELADTQETEEEP